VALSRYFASLGLKVLLVDADLRKPSLHEKLNLDNSIGFSNYLTGASLPPEVVQKTDHPNLAFMASGPLPPNAADLLGGNRVYSLISLGSEVFDLIVLDCPPVMGLADAQLLASATAATVFVVSAGMHRKGMIRAALRRLQLSRVGIVGTVLTRFDAKSVGYGYGYGYGHGYGYGYGYGYGGAHDKGEAGEMKKLPTPGLK
jgi:capsular exopolysaccharide synthesis family protein